MKYIQALGAALSKVGSIQVTKAEIEEAIAPMATEIFNCPVRNREGRTYETVLRNCSNIVGEYAIVKALKSLNENAQRNPHEWDHRVKDSYFYDVEHTVEDKKYFIEFKRMTGAWFSMIDDQVKTFKKNAQSLDALVTAYVDEYTDHYTVIFSMVIDPPSFEHYWTPSAFVKSTKKSSHYYSHQIASKRQHCSIVQIMTTRTKAYYDNLNFVIKD